MSRDERAIFTNMCMIRDGDRRMLVIDRKKPDWPGITFPGGHVEKCESFTRSVIREVKEETGLDIQSPVLCGIKQFQTEDDARYVVLFYRADRFTGELRSSDEGEVFWVHREELASLPLGQDFEDMLRVFESDDLSEFFWDFSSGEWKKFLL